MFKAVKDILVVSSDNSYRSQIAEAYLRHYARHRANIFSAGILKGEIHPKIKDILEEDALAFLRYDREYKNLLLVEQTNGDFGKTIMRQFFFDAYRRLLFERLLKSEDEQISAIADKSLKETKYHLKHSSEWVIRLGDGTEESHNRIQESLDALWKYTSELFFTNEVDANLIAAGIIPSMEGIEEEWKATVNNVLEQATLTIPTNNWKQEGGRIGKHTEHLGFLLAEMQYMQRTFPNMKW